MRPRRPQQSHQAAGIGILLIAFVFLALALLLFIPLLSRHEGGMIGGLGTPITALATARGRAAATATPTIPPTATPPPVVTPTATSPLVPTATAPAPTAMATSSVVPPPTATAPPVVAQPTATVALPRPSTSPRSSPGPIAPPTDTATPVPAVTSTPTPADAATPTPAASLGAITDPHFLSVLAARVIALTNHERVAHGLLPLTPDGGLSRIAVQRSEDMIQRNYFSHYDPVTHQPAVVDLLNRMVIPYHEVGENIIDNRNEPLNAGTPEQVVTAWMNSKEHRTNILDAAYTNIGVGIAIAQEGGALRVVFTQVFLD